MRTFFVILVSLVLGVFLGIGVTWAKYGLALNTWGVERSSGPPPQVVVDQEDFNFGDVKRDTTVEHRFRFSNIGRSPLFLKKGETSCMKCTIANLPQDVVVPGETVDVTVNYHAAITGRTFRQSATILTNDPQRGQVTLWVSGKIVAPYDVIPADLVFSKVRADETKTGVVNVHGFLEQPLEILGREWTEPETAPYFDASLQPLSEDELKEAGATSGHKLSVTIKPGLPLGVVRQRLRLSTNLPGVPSIDVPVYAKIESDMSILGRGWNAEKSVLNLGIVNGNVGTRRELQMQLLGPLRHDVRFQVEKVFPDFLQVKIGEPIDANSGEIVRVPLTIEVPPGSPAADHLDSARAKAGEVLLSTTHPQASQLKLSVRFAVEH